MNVKRMAKYSMMTAVLIAAQSASANNLIQNKGSDTLVNVAQAWAETYHH